MPLDFSSTARVGKTVHLLSAVIAVLSLFFLSPVVFCRFLAV
jgi:hypothetical protein